ncbi:MAG TPA: hypothetical protein VJK52_02295 [Candidatus Nanoarchaeia archaeon]|nr:hypothetical protein [Candidatus Nanoarchaeia archaeon]
MKKQLPDLENRTGNWLPPKPFLVTDLIPLYGLATVTIRGAEQMMMDRFPISDGGEIPKWFVRGFYSVGKVGVLGAYNLAIFYSILDTVLNR